MNAVETEMNTINITIAEVVATEIVGLCPDELLPITIAEILEADFRNDDEAEFLQEVISLQKDIENVLLSDNPEEFLLPTENDLSPAIMFLEKLEELKSYAFGDRTLARMERRIRGENLVVVRKMTETDKANHPDYRCCPKCERHFTKSYLGHHIDTPICIKVATAHNLRPINNQQKKVSKKIYNACLDLEDLYARAVAYKKHIEPELEEEDLEDDNMEERAPLIIEYNELVKRIKKIQTEDHFDIVKYGMRETEEGADMDEDEVISIERFSNDGIREVIENLKNALDGNELVEDECVYVIKTWDMDGKYSGLWDTFSPEYKKEFDTEKEARDWFNALTKEGGQDIYSAIRVIKIDPNSEDRETIIDEWEEELEEDECVYVIKTWEYNHKEDSIDYAGLWEDSEGNKEFKNEDEAKLQYEYATDGEQGYCAVSLVKIDPNSEDRETCIYDWEDNMSDYYYPCSKCGEKFTDENQRSSGRDDICNDCYVWNPKKGVSVAGKTWDGDDWQTDEEEEK
jgi:hypothetical protein